MRARAEIQVEGLVQGVGFRPFVARAATRLGLEGSVSNTLDGVWVVAEGPRAAVEGLVAALEQEAPWPAAVTRVSVRWAPPVGLVGFRIDASRAARTEAAAGPRGGRPLGRAGAAAQVPPDLGTCAACLADVDTPGNRRFGHPFASCTACGPRFTVTRTLPYDRARTTMADFPLCPACGREYADPADRRFHAEPIACPDCGPTLRLLDAAGRPLCAAPETIGRAQAMLSEGAVLAVKGLGGYHLACDATKAEAVRRVRALKARLHRPLAVLCRDIDVVERLCEVSSAERALLEGPVRPVVLLARRAGADGERDATGVPLAPEVAPGLPTLGVLLPYTPLHHLLVAPPGPPCLVLTSANRSGAPMATRLEQLPGLLPELDRGGKGASLRSRRRTPVVAPRAPASAAQVGQAAAARGPGARLDGILDHDRGIANRCDDSVVQVVGGRPVLLRRSRGYVPAPIPMIHPAPPTLALGALLHATAAVASADRVVISQHLGDLDTLESLAALQEAIAGLCALTGITPEWVVHDAHPDLPTTHLARRLVEGAAPWAGLSEPPRHRVPVQHHHAHFAAALTAARLRGPALGLVLDGTGWGPDGTVWGGEVLVGTAADACRAGHLLPMPLPGGDAATRRPIRIAAAYLLHRVPGRMREGLSLWGRLGEAERRVLERMAASGRVPVRTSSAGRLFDALSALLDCCDEISYDGQAAVALEACAGGARLDARDAARWASVGRAGVARHGDRWVLDPGPILEAVCAGRLAGAEPSWLARGAHGAVAEGFAELCGRLRAEGAPSTVVLAGGVFANRILLGDLEAALAARGLRPVLPACIPPGDGGLPVGQVAVAAVAGELRG